MTSDSPFRCRDCGRPESFTGLHYRCPDCGGIFSLAQHLIYDPVDEQGLARYHRSLTMPEHADLITLGEGSTPLVSMPMAGRLVYFKCEYLNPTGSFKDRGAAVMVSALAAAGVEGAFDDSSGNAGAAFAAYAARAGIHAQVLVPGYASGPKRDQIAAYGAELVAIEGQRSAVTQAALELAGAGGVYASHATLPHALIGNATLAYEIFEQLDRAPGCVIAPVGHGTLLLGVALGFQSLLEAGVIESMPALVGVQAQACQPIASAYDAGAAQPMKVDEGQTVAEGIRIRTPYRGDQVLKVIKESGGRMVSVMEADILAGRDALAAGGLYVEPTSAVVWKALQRAGASLQDPVVAVLTGSGLKYAASA